MIPFPFCLLFKSGKERWLAEEQQKLRRQYAPQLEAISATFQSRQSDLEAEIAKREDELKKKQIDLEWTLSRVDDREAELTKRNDELRSQIRLIEAKASPDGVWVEAFTAGFTKAWDMMQPLMTDGVVKMKQTIRDEAIDETLRGLETHIAWRIDAAANTQLKSANEVLSKKEDLRSRIASSKIEEEKIQLTHYLEALDWIQVS